jgi:hypothetical protein
MVQNDIKARVELARKRPLRRVPRMHPLRKVPWESVRTLVTGEVQGVHSERGAHKDASETIESGPMKGLSKQSPQAR